MTRNVNLNLSLSPTHSDKWFKAIWSACFAISLAGLAARTVVQAAPLTSPINDNFSDRIVLEGSSVTFTGTLAGATLEPLESDWTYARQVAGSVWWSWTAPASGPAIMQVLQVSTNTLRTAGFEVFSGTGSSSGLTFVKGNTFGAGRRPFVVFNATSNTTYTLRVSGTNVGSFAMRLVQTNAPTMMIQPRSRTVAPGESVFFGALAAGEMSSASPIGYQWKFNGNELPGETARILLLDSVSANQAGAYTVAVSNATTTIVSDEATLAVAESATPPRLVVSSNINQRFGFYINGEPGRFYFVESSTDLLSWTEEKSFPDEFMHFRSDSERVRSGVVYSDGTDLVIPVTQQQAGSRYYRVRTYRPAAGICVNHLDAARFAKDLWALENVGLDEMTPLWSEILAYFNSAQSVACPLGGPANTFQLSYLINSLSSNPSCRYSLSHVLDSAEDYCQ